MRSMISLVLLSFLAAAADAPATQPEGALLRIRVVDARSTRGQMIFGVFNQPAGFPSVKEKSINWQIKPATDSLVFECRLPPGKYSASVLHDENNSHDMDKNFIGIPKEGYGVTNNPKPRRRAATFREAQFDVPPESAELTISMQYF
jgi:uncharacterized protein (DUF2141 family)